MTTSRSGHYNPIRERVLAFYLPQFHPIPENDEWWGPGFTEWTNVAKAKPLFRGHRQPHVPADLGFYDLRVPEVREKQAELARGAGVEGFCYWHYWFGGGRRILERPFREVLASGQPDFPFCLAWANQTWTGVWHGNPKHVLVSQTYPGEEDEVAHFHEVLPAFRDPRYVKIDGKPLFAMLDPREHPDPGAFVRHWRRLAEAAGLPGIFFVGMWNAGPSPRLDEFDAVTEFGPGDYIENLPRGWRRKIRQARRGDFGTKAKEIIGTPLLRPARFDYRDVIAKAFSRPLAADPRFVPTIMPNWDNTPRSGVRGVVYDHATPALFGAYVRKALEFIRTAPKQNILFIKSWNEWAEGNYLEPDLTYGKQYLDALRKALAE